MATVHIIGAGISGLAAATALAEAHIPVKLYESSPHAGGRCRTGYTDAKEMDHGAHLIDRIDKEFLVFLNRIGASGALTKANLPSLPRASIADYTALFRMFFAHSMAKTSDYIQEENPLHQHWLAPLADAKVAHEVNTLPARAIRKLIRQRQPLMANAPLSEAFIAPALQHLEQCGGSVYFNHGLQSLAVEGNRIVSLHFARKKISITPADWIILATPAQVTSQLIPTIITPREQHRSLVIAFYTEYALPADTLEWIVYPNASLVRYRNGRIEVTIRSAECFWHRDPAAFAAQLWRALQRQQPALRAVELPPYTVWKEKSAGHVLRMEKEEREPVFTTEYRHCLLAGDWLNQALPASLESAAASGHRAALYIKSLISRGPMQQREPV